MQQRKYAGRGAPLAVALATALIVVPSASSFAQASTLDFSAAFSPVTIGPGSTTTLTFTVENDDAFALTDLSFVNDLPDAITVASPANLVNGCGGVVDLRPADAGGKISVTGGAVDAGEECTISVDVTSDTLGSHANATSPLTSSAGVDRSAGADLTVTAALPGFSKSFEATSIPLDHRTTLTFTIDNSLNTLDVTEFRFADELPRGMVIADPSGAVTDCGPAALPAPFSPIMAVPGSQRIEFAAFGFLPGGNQVVAGGGTCTVAVDVVGGEVGTMGSSTGLARVELDDSGDPVGAGKAAASLDVTASDLHLHAEFVDDPVLPGASSTLRFTVTNFDRTAGVTAVGFVDDLSAALAGLVATEPLPSDPCGAGSILSGGGTGVLALEGGAIEAGGNCTFDVSVAVPAGASSRATNTTGPVTGAIDDVVVTGNVATDDLFVVLAPRLTKRFTDDPQGAGGSVTLEYTVVNADPDNAMTDIEFDDVFDPVLPSASVVAGTVAQPPPAGVVVNNVCGVGSVLGFTPLDQTRDAAPAMLTLADGSLAAGDSCSFAVELDVSASAASRGYSGSTTPIVATVLSTDVAGGPATDELAVVGAPPLRKLFLDNPVDQGATVRLLYTVVNGGDGQDDFDSIGPIDEITFTDDLAAVPGLTAVAPLPTDPCGAGSSLDASGGGTRLTLTAGNLLADASCTFAITLQTTPSTPPGRFISTTGAVSATASGIPVSGPGDRDVLVVNAVAVVADSIPTSAAGSGEPVDPQPVGADLSVTMAGHADTVIAGDTVTYTIDVFNSGPDTASGVVVADDLPQSDGGGFAATLVSTSGCRNDPFTLSCELGDLAAGTGASFTITVRVAADAAGTIANIATVTAETPDIDLADNVMSSATIVFATGAGSTASIAGSPPRR